MKKLYAVLILCAVMSTVSCTPDNQVADVPPQINFEQYTHETFNNDGSDYRITTGSIANNQLQTVTYVGFGGVVSNPAIYNYDGTLLVFFDNLGSMTAWGDWNFYHDADGQLIGAKKGEPEGGVIYFRYVYVSIGTVYWERTTLPYDNPAAQIVKRCIVEFDENDNIIKAGVDSNLDGIREDTHEFVYDDGDIVSIQTDGNSTGFSYSDIIDSASLLMDNSFGKRTRRLMYADEYSDPGISNSIHTRNYHISEANAALGTYEIAPNGCYSKHTVVGSTDTSITTYYFN